MNTGDGGNLAPDPVAACVVALWVLQRVEPDARQAVTERVLKRRPLGRAQAFAGVAIA
jgi:hypothetical protein